ncbi:hypothetical protein Javan284_0016 [Streptococcus phage Javan284]|uniref:Phage protein n=1 Tax=Streptococcus lutetiensis 033 TaxID=1076934 RepID=A0AB33AMI7_9STRE|nr:hypothetical protein [Streptococcus lutetiensis]AGS05872.1 hypothetical protein KE3_1397 [Streptococcus lutetiensis 033]QBX25968.1 hypothetical protein Javan284_0016 [Streptococcus phage Javan284]RHF37855.1 hypothetical protein DW688_04630 [Streptococcus lutetiensis]
MSRVYNFDAKQDAIEFVVGDCTLEFMPSDEQSKKMQAKADELKQRANSIDGIANEDSWGAVQEIKAVLDEFFKTMFDNETPEKLYKAVGQNTMTYLKVFLQISKAINEVNAERQNDEYFKQFLSE